MSRIEGGIPFEHYLPGTYTMDPDFKMPTVKQPPAQPATPTPPAFQVGDKLHIVNSAEGWEARGVVVGFDPAFKNGAPVYMINGKIVAIDAEYLNRTYQDYLNWLFDESHIVRGYD